MPSAQRTIAARVDGVTPAGDLGGDPLSGSDDLWAEEDWRDLGRALVWSGSSDPVPFSRALFLAIVGLNLLLWLGLAGAAVGAYVLVT